VLTKWLFYEEGLVRNSADFKIVRLQTNFALRARKDFLQRHVLDGKIGRNMSLDVVRYLLIRDS
jgi:hypothetical protein